MGPGVVGGHLSIIRKRVRVFWEELEDSLVTKWPFTPEWCFLWEYKGQVLQEGKKSTVQ